MSSQASERNFQDDIIAALLGKGCAYLSSPHVASGFAQASFD